MSRVVAACREMVGAGGPLPAETLAQRAGCSVRQLVRAFDAVVGVPPRSFGQAVRTGEARRMLRHHAAVTDAVWAAGFGSTRAFYDTTGPTLGMTPRTYARGAAGQRLRWTSVATPIGLVLGVAGDLGLAAVRIGHSVDAMMDEVRAEFPDAHLERDDDGLADLGLALRALASGRQPAPLGAESSDEPSHEPSPEPSDESSHEPGASPDPDPDPDSPSSPHALPDVHVPLELMGTAFQARVWSALRRIPAGTTRTYAQVAADIGAPTAVRAVASACARNPVALVVPCHRVVRSDGGLGGFRWGLEVKAALLDAERRDRQDTRAPEPAHRQGPHA